MSQVRVSERNESKIQFVDTARELVVHTLHYARKFPKAAMFLLTKDIVDYAKNVYLHTVCANDIFPKTPADVESRKKHLDFTIGCLDTMDCFLGIMKDDYSDAKITDYGWVHWGELIFKEKNLIKKVLASDAKLAF